MKVRGRKEFRSPQLEVLEYQVMGPLDMSLKIDFLHPNRGVYVNCCRFAASILLHGALSEAIRKNAKHTRLKVTGIIPLSYKREGD